MGRPPRSNVIATNAYRRTRGGTRDEVEAQMKDAISFHLDGLKEEGTSLPEPHTSSSYVEVPV